MVFAIKKCTICTYTVRLVVAQFIVCLLRERVLLVIGSRDREIAPTIGLSRQPLTGANSIHPYMINTHTNSYEPVSNGITMEV